MKNLISIVLNRTFAAVLLASAFVLISGNTAFSIGVCTNITANSSASVAVGTNPRQVVTGDLNGDNFIDSVVLTGNSGSGNTISVLLNNGRGTLSNFNNLTTNIAIGAITLGDFNLDGALDIAAAASSSFSSSTPLFVYSGNGNGTFGTPSTTNFAGSAIALTKGDFNSDGFPDIAIANNSSSGGFGAVTLFLNAGFGSFNFVGNFPVSGIPRDIQTADFNGDNLQDVAVINTNNTGSILLGTGTGSFQSASSFPLFSSSSSSFNVSFAIGDLNNDTRPDLAVANGDTNTLSVLINSGAGSFNPPSTITLPDFNYRSRSIIIGQYVGDANLDIAVTVNSGFSDSLSAAVIVPGLGNGTFGTNLTITPTGSLPISIADGDFNNDGLTDLITANSGSGDVSVIINTANSRFGPRTFPTNGNPNQIVTTDFNGDGNLDYAVSNAAQNPSPNPNGIFISFGDGNGGISGTLSLSLSLTQALLTTDVNRDGRADLITISAGQSSNSVVNVYVNRGTTPIFSNPADQTYALNFNAKSIVNGDFNNDGNVDLVVTASSGNNTAILLGTNAGTFNPPSGFASPASSAFVVAGNFDSDSDLDLLFVGTGFNGQSGVFTLLGNGNGTFSQVSEVFPVSSALTAVAADFNKDGKTDIAVTSGSTFSGGTSSLFVAFGDGDGTFTLSSIYSAGLNPAFPSIADVNSDSFPDIVLANRTSNSITVLLNNRNGTFRYR